MTAEMKGGDGAGDAPTAEPDGSRLEAWVVRYGMYLALGAAWTAMLGSLFFSELLHWVPCSLCWYQRIAMYPIALLIPVALLLRERGLPLYTLTLATIGLCLSAYHWLHQKVDWFDAVKVCASGVSCKGDYLGRGLVTIPFLAFVAFLVVAFASLAVRRRGGPEPLGRGATLAGIAAAIAVAAALTLALMWLLPPVRLQWLGA